MNKIIILIIIIILALAGIGAIVYISSRAKCVLPEDKTQCDTGESWICDSIDSEPKCDTDANVCGPKPDSFTSEKCTTVDCQYDKTSNKYIWVCNGPGRPGVCTNIPMQSAPCVCTWGLFKGKPGTKYCTDVGQWSYCQVNDGVSCDGA